MSQDEEIIVLELMREHAINVVLEVSSGNQLPTEQLMFIVPAYTRGEELLNYIRGQAYAKNTIFEQSE